MYIEVKETSKITTKEDVEKRLYHAFQTLRNIPVGISPCKYKSPLASIIGEGENFDLEIIKKSQATAKDISLMDEVLDKWLNSDLLTVDEKHLIAFRAGASMGQGFHEQFHYWSGIRGWKTCAFQFNCCRNTAKNKFNTALNTILHDIKTKMS